MLTSSTKLFTVSSNENKCNVLNSYINFCSSFPCQIVARRKTIYEYHRVNFNGQDIKNDTLITLTALPTCLEHTNCGECLSAELEAFNVSISFSPIVQAQINSRMEWFYEMFTFFDVVFVAVYLVPNNESVLDWYRSQATRVDTERLRAVTIAR